MVKAIDYLLLASWASCGYAAIPVSYSSSSSSSSSSISDLNTSSSAFNYSSAPSGIGSVIFGTGGFGPTKSSGPFANGTGISTAGGTTTGTAASTLSTADSKTTRTLLPSTSFNISSSDSAGVSSGSSYSVGPVAVSAGASASTSSSVLSSASSTTPLETLSDTSSSVSLNVSSSASPVTSSSASSLGASSTVSLVALSSASTTGASSSISPVTSSSASLSGTLSSVYSSAHPDVSSNATIGGAPGALSSVSSSTVSSASSGDASDISSSSSSAKTAGTLTSPSSGSQPSTSPRSQLSSPPAPTHTTGASASPAPAAASTTPLSTAPGYVNAPFVVSGSISVPAQTAYQTSGIDTETMTAVTGTPGSVVAVKTTNSLGDAVFGLLWFLGNGLGILKKPHINLSGVIQPPTGQVPAIIDPSGDAVPEPNFKGSDPEPDPESKSPNDPSSQSQAETSTADPTSSMTTSSTSCTQSAVTQEIVSCLTVVASGTTGTLSCTTSTSTATGCEAIGLTSTTIATSTESSTASLTSYIIFPQASASKSDRQSLDNELTGQVGKDNVSSLDDGDGPNLWLVPLNETQVKQFMSSSSVVSTIIPNPTVTIGDISSPTASASSAKTAVKRAVTTAAGSASNRAPRSSPIRGDGASTAKLVSFKILLATVECSQIRSCTLVPRCLTKKGNWTNPYAQLRRDIASQDDALDQLKIVSQGQGKTLAETSYHYDSSAGSGVYLYIIDTGANAAQQQYQILSNANRVEWLFPGDQSETMDDNGGGHGSCVLSVAATEKWGVAKQVNVVVVKLKGMSKKNLHTGTDDFVFTDFDVLTAVSATQKHITENNRQNKAVVNMSFKVEIEHEMLIKYLKDKTDLITGAGVTIVTAAGNSGNNVEIDDYPQKLAEDNNGVIVVGSTDTQGELSYFSQEGSVVSIYAVGEDITCMAAQGADSVVTGWAGTSFASPAVAGLAAYQLALPQNGLGGKTGQALAEQMKSVLTGKAYAREGSDKKVLFNGITGLLPNCGSSARKRDGSNDTCSLPMSSVSESMTTFVTSARSSSFSSSVQSASSSFQSSSLTSSPNGSSTSTLFSKSTVSPPSSSTFVSTSNLTTTLASESTSASTDASTTKSSSLSSMNSTTSSSTTSASSTSSTMAPTISDPPACEITSSPSNGLPQPVAMDTFQKYCSEISGGSVCVGSDGTLLIGNVNKACSDGASPLNSNTRMFSNVNGTNLDMSIGVSIESGSLFAVNQTTCLEAFGVVTNDCAPLSAATLGDLQKWGGSILVNDGNGDSASFFWSIADSPPPPPPSTTSPPPPPATSSIDFGSVSCAPTATPTIGVGRDTIHMQISQFCNEVPADSVCVQNGDVIIGNEASANCDFSSESVELSLSSPLFSTQDLAGIKGFNFDIALVEGHQFAINSSLCETALGMALDDCNTNSLSKYGGSVAFSDGNGDAARFSIDLILS